MSLAPVAFAGAALDRDDHLRGDPARLAALLAGDAMLLHLDGLAPEMDAAGRLQWLPASAAPPGTELVFLGMLDGVARFGAVPTTGDADPAYAHRKSWAAIALLGGGDLAIYGTARSVLDWHARHRFCARCGQPTVLAKGGWQRDCTAEACKGQHFPRTDPVAIMLVEHDGQVLLGRQSRFPPRSYSALAGFIEPGESIEEAVAREIFEEAGVRIRDVTYIASQPWPFPSQLMIGCIGHADSFDLTIDATEIEHARWFTRAEVAEAVGLGAESPGFLPPPRQAIAHHLLEWWLEKDL
jgi:NAD+ diphosphatase